MAPGPSQSSALEENDPEPGLSLPPLFSAEDGDWTRLMNKMRGRKMTTLVQLVGGVMRSGQCDDQKEQQEWCLTKMVAKLAIGCCEGTLKIEITVTNG